MGPPYLSPYTHRPSSCRHSTPPALISAESGAGNALKRGRREGRESALREVPRSAIPLSGNDGEVLREDVSDERGVPDRAEV